jgi:hypothetical protein
VIGVDHGNRQGHRLRRRGARSDLPARLPGKRDPGRGWTSRRTRALPKSPIGEAVGYARNQWTALTSVLHFGLDIIGSKCDASRQGGGEGAVRVLRFASKATRAGRWLPCRSGCELDPGALQRRRRPP